MRTFHYLAMNVQRLRMAQNLSQKALAQRAAMSHVTIYLIETERAGAVQIATINKLAVALGVKCWELLYPSYLRKSLS